MILVLAVRSRPFLLLVAGILVKDAVFSVSAEGNLVSSVDDDLGAFVVEYLGGAGECEGGGIGAAIEGDDPALGNGIDKGIGSAALWGSCADNGGGFGGVFCPRFRRDSAFAIGVSCGWKCWGSDLGRRFGCRFGRGFGGLSGMLPSGGEMVSAVGSLAISAGGSVGRGTSLGGGSVLVSEAVSVEGVSVGADSTVISRVVSRAVSGVCSWVGGIDSQAAMENKRSIPKNNPILCMGRSQGVLWSEEEGVSEIWMRIQEDGAEGTTPLSGVSVSKFFFWRSPPLQGVRLP